MKIIVFKDKYCTRYFKADTKEQLNHAALTIMKERLEQKWYSRPREPQYLTEVSEEIYQQLPAALKETEDRNRKRNREEKKYYESQILFFQLLDAEIEKPSGNAFQILRLRRDHQYEGFEIQELEG